MVPEPLIITVCSSSSATLAFMETILTGFRVTVLRSIEEVHSHLSSQASAAHPEDFIILDDQTERHADDLAKFVGSLGGVLQETKVIQLYTPTMSRTGHPVFGKSSTPGVVRMTKPPRRARILQTLAGLKNLPHEISPSHVTDIAKAVDDVSTAQRILNGHVLVAEG